MSTEKKSLQLSAFTMLSRVLGLVRDRFQAVLFGTGEVASAWEIAYMLPNMLRNLLAEGVLSQSFIPLFSKEWQKSPQAAAQAAGVIITFLLFFVSLLVMLGVFVFPWALPVINNHQPNSIFLVELARILFVFILFASLSAIFMGISQTHHRFFVPALGPVLLNLVFIAGYIFLIQQNWGQKKSAHTLAWVVILGGFLQLCLQAGYVYYKGVGPRPSLQWRHPILKKIFLLMAPAVVGASMFQLNQLLDVAIASYFIPVETGAVPALRFAHRLIQLPTGIIGVAISTVILPTLSRSLHSGDGRHSTEFTNAISFSLFLTVPAALGLFFLREDIINLIYFGGRWDKHSTQETCRALQFFALGVPFFSLNKILTSSYYAHEDTKTPVRVLLAMVLLNFGLNLLLVRPLQQGGIALSTAASSLGSVLLLYFFLGKKGLGIDMKKFSYFLMRAFFLWISIGIFLFYWKGLADAWLIAHEPGLLVHYFGAGVNRHAFLVVLPGIAIVMGFYFFGAYFLGLREIEAVFQRRR